VGSQPRQAACQPESCHRPRLDAQKRDGRRGASDRRAAATVGNVVSASDKDKALKDYL